MVPPAVPGPAGSGVAPATPDGARDLATATVLVVDDDPAGAAATRAMLAAAGYTTAAETAGDAALRLVRSSRVRLVVSELRIPCAEGLCVVAALKQDRTRLPRLRVLVHTRHTTRADLEWALAAGADAVVPKSARHLVLLREVRRLLDGAIVS